MEHYKRTYTLIPIPEFGIFVENMVDPLDYVTSNFETEQLEGNKPLHKAIRMSEGKIDFWELYWNPQKKVLEVPGYGLVEMGTSYEKVAEKSAIPPGNDRRPKRREPRFEDKDRN